MNAFKIQRILMETIITSVIGEGIEEHTREVKVLNKECWESW